MQVAGNPEAGSEGDAGQVEAFDWEECSLLHYILKTHCELQATYGALRGNDLQADFVRKPYLLELLYVIEGLRENYGVEKVLETVMRYGKLLEVGYDDLTALKKLGSWPLDILSKLTAIFKLFEAFQTEDAKELVKRKITLIMEGKKTVRIPNNLFRKVGKMSPDFFNQVAERISLRELSLKQAAEDFSKHSSRKDTMACIMQIVPGHMSSKEIVTAYPGKFSSEVLDTFAGAVVTKATENEKGKSLQDYCKNIYLVEV